MQLLHYPAYKEHEVKALWEFLQASGRQLEVVGIMGGFAADQAVVLEPGPDSQGRYMHQGVAFLVL